MCSVAACLYCRSERSKRSFRFWTTHGGDNSFQRLNGNLHVEAFLIYFVADINKNIHYYIMCVLQRTNAVFWGNNSGPFGF